jgi:hypothetical protein
MKRIIAKILGLLMLFMATSFFIEASALDNMVLTSIQSSDNYPILLKISNPIPNPVENYTKVFYNIPDDYVAEMVIYNLAGVKIKSEPIKGGKGSVNFDTSKMQSGIYFVSMVYQGRNLDSKRIVKK